MKKIVMIAIIFILAVLITGCWDRKEPEDRALVIGAGYDYNPETDMYKLIVQLESPLVAQDQQGGISNKPAYWTIAAWGETPIDAIANIRKKASREIYYAHLHLLVISEEMARSEGIVTVLETVTRSRQSRPIVDIAVARGDVEKILTADYTMQTTNALGLLSQIEVTEGELGTAIRQNVRQFLNKLSTPGIEPIASNLKLLESGEELARAGKEPDSPPVIKTSGLTAFYQDKMRGRLNDSEARGWNWICGHRKSGIINFTYPGKKESKVTVVVHRGSNQIIPYFKDNQPGIKIKMHVEGRIESITKINEFKEESGLTQSMEKRLAEAVRTDINKAIAKAKSLKSDVFGFGNSFYRLKYDKWIKFSNDWPEIFTEIPVEIEVEAVIRRTGLSNRGLRIH